MDLNQDDFIKSKPQKKINVPQAVQDFYNERMAALGVTDDNNIIGIKSYNILSKKNEIVDHKIFSANENGIEIKPYTLSRNHILSGKESDRWRKDFSITRLLVERVKANGDKMKYDIPKGSTTPPFFPPILVKHYEEKTPIKTLFITEGYFKAWKACLDCLFCVGLVSITTMVDRNTGKFHGDVLELIKVCQVERIVFLTDADARQISKEAITPDRDLYRRPYSFYSAINRFSELFSSMNDDIKIYFAHINEDLESKGIDDLLINSSGEIKEIIKDANNFDKIKEGRFIGNYFTKFNINYGCGSVYRYFFLNDVTLFYLHHIETRKDLIQQKFTFNGTQYIYSDKDGSCTIEIPKTAKNYFRVGDHYYEFVKIPNRYGELTDTYHSRQKSTIKDDNGKYIFDHIEKYKAFCNTPSHTNYQRVINECFNTYRPFMHEPDSGDCEQTIDFLKHIFGTAKVELQNGTIIERWELGLDYLTILYKKPQQILPILCLVSKERQTGKTSFIKWLKLIFTENAAIVGNNDFEDSFNAHWISKLLVMVDETKIDKQKVVEKIKSLSTSNYAMINSKGKDQNEIEIFLKFILLSNNVEDFIYIDKEEIRFWVIEVPTIPSRVNEIETILLDEIPAFLHFLNTRKMATEHEERHHFNTKYLQTEALRLIKQNSSPTIWKTLKERITNIFETHDIMELEMPFADIRDYLLRSKYDDNYLKRTLKENGYTLGQTARGSYPKYIETTDPDGNITKKGIAIKFFCRTYKFLRHDFTDTLISAEQLDLLDPTLPF